MEEAGDQTVPWVSHSALCQGTPVCSSSSLLGNKLISKSLFSSRSPQTHHSHVQHFVNPILVFPVPSGLDRLVGAPQPPNPLLSSRTGNSRGPSCSFPALLCPAISRCALLTSQCQHRSEDSPAHSDVSPWTEHGLAPERSSRMEG